MKKAEVVLKKVLESTTPTEKERKGTKEAIDRIMKSTEKVIKPLKLKKTLAGSFLRDTWLADKQEFDIFILFPPIVAREKLEKRGLEIGKKIVAELKGKYEIAYAEHPYIRAVVDGYAVDFVPCYDIKNPGRIKSAVDRTPHHNRYMLKKMNSCLSPQVRLLKQFCKGIGVYGSDLRVEGFSGYLTELLIINYKTLKDLMLDAQGWEAGHVFIDLEGHHGEKGLDTAKRYPGQPMVVIDPVDENRNVAAAVSPSNFELFKQSCRMFLKKPSEVYFRTKRIAMGRAALLREARNRDTRLLAISFRRPPVVDDVIFPQLRRSARRIRGMLSEEDFKVLDHDVWCDQRECVIMIELETWSLPATKKLTGPPIFAKVHSQQFIGKYKGKSRLWVEGRNWVTEIKRKFPKAKEFLKKSLKAGEKQLVADGIASHAARSLVKGFTIIEDESVIKRSASNPGFALFLTQYFKKKII